MRLSRLKVALACAVSAVLYSTPAIADDWIGGNGTSWGAVTPTVPGWSPSVPNAQGAVAQKTDAVTGTVTADFAVTVGTINLGGSSNVAFGITPTSLVTLDQDGAGPLSATISNTNTNTGTTPALVLNNSATGGFFLADDLLISNTSTSTRTTGAIILNGALVGTGNVSFYNTSNAYPLSSSSFAGAIRIQTTATTPANINTFTGNVTMRKGLVSFSHVASFGNSANVITMGTGEGSLSLLSTAGIILPNNIVVNNPDDGVGTPDVALLGSNGTLVTGNIGYSGGITLNSTVTLAGPTWSGANGNGTIFSGNITGTGGVTKQDGTLPISVGVVTLSGTNSYTGVTNVKNGTLQFAKTASLYNGNAGAWTPANLVVEPGAIASFYVGGADEFTVGQVQSIMAGSTATGLFKSGAGVGFNTENTPGGNLVYSTPLVDLNGGVNSTGYGKFGANTMTLTAANTYTGATYVNGGILQFAKRAALYNADTSKWTAANLNVGAGGTAAFNVGGSGEFSVAEVVSLASLGTATGGFMGVNAAVAGASNVGIDTTNAVGTSTISSNIANPNGGQNPIGVTKLGSGTLELTGTNTYTGSTVVDGGTLRLAGGSHTVDPVTTANVQVAVTNEVGNYRIGSLAGTTGAMIVDGSTITSDSGLMIGEGGTGSFTINSGTVATRVDSAGGNQFIGIGRLAGSNGTYLQNAGTVSTTDWFVTGVSGTGTATIVSGSLTCNTVAVAQNGTANGTFTLNGGTVNINGGHFYASLNNQTTPTPASSTSVVKINGGSLTVATGVALLGNQGNCDYTQTGGTFKTVAGGARIAVAETATSTSTFTMSGGLIEATADWFILGRSGSATGTLSGTGEIKAGLNFVTAEMATANATMNMNGGKITSGSMYISRFGSSTLNQTAGDIALTSFASIAREASGIGTWNMSGGTFTNTVDLNIGDFGAGTLNYTGGTINCGNLVVAYNASSTSTATINAPTGVITSTRDNGFFVGLAGTGTMNLESGSLVANSVGGDFRIGNNATGNGTLNMSGGSVTISDQSYVGVSGTGTLNLSNGTWTAGDNFYVGTNATGNGTVTMTGGTINFVGNDPSFTGNLLIGRSGIGSFDLQAGTLNFNVPASTGFSNSASAAYAASTQTSLTTAQDGNLAIGSGATGVGTMTMSGGTANVAANLLLGADGGAGLAGGKGTLTMSGGNMRVGQTSPTGGDVVLALIAGAEGTLNLSGGTLDVSSGSGKIAAGLGTSAFTFTGGTLKVKEFNASDFGGTIGPAGELVQDGATSVLSVVSNNTAIFSNYNLGAGSATIANGHSLTATSVINSPGTGIITVGTGAGAAGGDYNANGVVDSADYVLWRKNPGAYGGTPAGYNVWRANYGATSSGPSSLSVGSGTIAADTLNLNNGSVTATGGVAVDTALNGNGTITGSVVMAAGATVAPGPAAGKLTFANNLNLGSSGILAMQLGGTAPVTGYDQIDVVGALAIGGTLQVSFINGYTPSPGTSFNILDFGSRTGTFSSVILPSGSWNQSALYTTGVLTFLAPGVGSGAAVPEPTAVGLLAVALCGLIGTRSARRCS